MSMKPMTLTQKRERRLAAADGERCRDCIELAQPWNRNGDQYVDESYRYGRRAARHARRSLGRDRRKEHNR